jgi:transposase
MLIVEISEKDKQLLKELRYRHPHPHVMRKMDALYLKSCGLDNISICSIVGVCANTLLKYFRQYMDKGVEGLKEINFNKPNSALKEYSGSIEKYFTENPPSSISEACAKIEMLTGIKRKETQVRKFLKSLNFRFLKSGSIPAKALTEEKNEQREFLEKDLEPRLTEAKSGERSVYFVDAAHFVCGALLGYIWSIFRIFIPTMSGRQRYNVLGAINAVTHDFCCICNETYINAMSVCDLLRKIKKTSKDNIPITIVLDNARYQRCKLVMQVAVELQIELLFLPSYSPNLNIIERYWKWLRKDCLNCKYYETFEKFKNAIDLSLKKTMNHENKTELKTLLNLKFQLYDNSIYERA